MITDKQTILCMHDVLDLGATGKETPPLYAWQFDHLEQTNDMKNGPWFKVRKGRKPTMRYVTACYLVIAIPGAKAHDPLRRRR